MRARVPASVSLRLAGAGQRRGAEALQRRQRQRGQGQLAADPGRAELQVALEPRRAEREVEPVDVQGVPSTVTVAGCTSRSGSPASLPESLRHPDRLAGSQDVERCGGGEVERLAGLVAGGRGRDVERREPAADGRAWRRSTATSGAANPCARRLASMPPRPAHR